jgi:hypothetical protein
MREVILLGATERQLREEKPARYEAKANAAALKAAALH